MIVHDCAQGEAEWLKLRVGKVTASEASALLTPDFKIRDGETPKTYLLGKLAEGFRGEPLPGFTSWETEQGQILEDEARRWFSFSTEHKISNVGFCEHDSGRCGASPDALLDDDGGLELKCPQPTNHVRYLLDGILPKDYAVQVHFSLYATGRKWWKFVSYRRRFPAFVLTVQRDETIIAKIDQALAGFFAKYDAALRQLKEMA